MTQDNVSVLAKQHQVSIDTVISLLDYEKGKLEQEKFQAIKRRAQDLTVTAEEALGHMSDIRAINVVYRRMKARLEAAKTQEQQAVKEPTNG